MESSKIACRTIRAAAKKAKVKVQTRCNVNVKLLAGMCASLELQSKHR